MKVLPMMSEHCIRDQNMAEFLDIVSESVLMPRFVRNQRNSVAVRI